MPQAPCAPCLGARRFKFGLAYAAQRVSITHPTRERSVQTQFRPGGRSCRAARRGISAHQISVFWAAGGGSRTRTSFRIGDFKSVTKLDTIGRNRSQSSIFKRYPTSRSPSLGPFKPFPLDRTAKVQPKCGGDPAHVERRRSSTKIRVRKSLLRMRENRLDRTGSPNL